MMYKRLKGFISLFAVAVTLLASSGVFAGPQSKTPDRIREVFAMSGSPKLQLAAEALGDDQLLTLLEELKKEAPGDKAIQKAIRNLK
jgi:hypothetical protein